MLTDLPNRYYILLTFSVMHDIDKLFADFLKVEMSGIVSYLETEFAEIETNTERMDLNFKLEDGI